MPTLDFLYYSICMNLCGVVLAIAFVAVVVMVARIGIMLFTRLIFYLDAREKARERARAGTKSENCGHRGDDQSQQERQD